MINAFKSLNAWHYWLIGAALVTFIATATTAYTQIATNAVSITEERYERAENIKEIDATLDDYYDDIDTLEDHMISFEGKLENIAQRLDEIKEQQRSMNDKLDDLR